MQEKERGYHFFIRQILLLRIHSSKEVGYLNISAH